MPYVDYLLITHPTPGPSYAELRRHRKPYVPFFPRRVSRLDSRVDTGRATWVVKDGVVSLLTGGRRQWIRTADWLHRAVSTAGCWSPPGPSIFQSPLRSRRQRLAGISAEIIMRFLPGCVGKILWRRPREPPSQSVVGLTGTLCFLRDPSYEVIVGSGERNPYL